MKADKHIDIVCVVVGGRWKHESAQTIGHSTGRCQTDKVHGCLHDAETGWAWYVLFEHCSLWVVQILWQHIGQRKTTQDNMQDVCLCVHSQEGGGHLAQCPWKVERHCLPGACCVPETCEANYITVVHAELFWWSVSKLWSPWVYMSTQSRLWVDGSPLYRWKWQLSS